MAIDLSDEILQDFQVEAGEILEQLGEQLVDLEQSPDDKDLLNSVFRGFHTIKGGAGFLSLTSMVEVCHQAEDTFNLLRNDELDLTPAMMDAFLLVLDEISRMFDQIREAVDPDPAPPELMQQLVAMQVPGPLTETTVAGSADEECVSESNKISFESRDCVELSANDGCGSPSDVIQHDEFEDPLESTQAKETGSGASSENGVGLGNADSSDEITDEEFESLLDSLQDMAPDTGSKSDSTKTLKAPSDSEFITDKEFEDLLDDMHGKDTIPTKSAAPKAPLVEIGNGVEAKSSANTESSAIVAKSAGQNTATTETTVRVGTETLDKIMNMVGELVLVRNRLNTFKETISDDQVQQAIANLGAVTGNLQTAIMKTRMQPVKKVFSRFTRVVRDLARNLGKEVDLEMTGEETDLDKNLVEALADPLVHLVRNSVDHGIESPQQREAAGKSQTGKIILTAKQEGDFILLSITDDGAGMDPEILRRNVVDSGLMDYETAACLDDKECFELIFMPGLTTKQNISDVSGRGVGMDVVKTGITRLNGTIDIDSVIGRGTVINIKVPLTLAILPTLMIQLGMRKFALPLSSVTEIFKLSLRQTNDIDGKEVVLNRGKASPIFRLRRWLLNGSGGIEPSADNLQVVMVQVANTRVGLVVDHVIGQEEVVIKPLGEMLQGLPGMAGSTITGDGKIAIVLDVPGLLEHYA